MNQLNKQLDVASNEMWPRIADLHDHALEGAKAKLRVHLTRTCALAPSSPPVPLCHATHRDAHPGLGLSEEELNTREEELRERAFAVIKDRLTEKSQHIQYQMQKKYPQAPQGSPSYEWSPNLVHGVPRFDETFRLDPDGLPRRWSKADNIEETFKEARQQVTFASPPHR